MKKKWVPREYDYTDCDKLAEYLREMAGRGWGFKRFCMGLVFEECAPCEEAYNVQVFLKNGDGDLAPTDDTLEYANYCEAAGWELVDSSARFVVFRQVREDAVPIVTPREKLDAAFRAQRRRGLQNLLGMGLFLFIFCRLEFMLDLRLIGTAGNVFDPVFLSAALLFFVFFLEEAAGLVSLLIWKRASEAAIERRGDFRCVRGGAYEMVKTAFGICGDLLLVQLLGIALWSLLRDPVPLTGDRIRAIVPYTLIFLLIWGSNLYDRWKRPAAEDRQRRTVLVLLALGVGIWFVTMYRNAYGTDAPGEEAVRVREVTPPLAITDLVELADGLEWENYSSSCRKNLLGSWLRYDYDGILQDPEEENPVEAQEKEPDAADRAEKAPADQEEEAPAGAEENGRILSEEQEEQPGKTDGPAGEGGYLTYEVSRTQVPALADWIWKELTRYYSRTVTGVEPEDSRQVSDVSGQWEASCALCVEWGSLYTYYVEYRHEKGRAGGDLSGSGDQRSAVLVLEADFRLDGNRIRTVRDRLDLQ